jgi:hypothetical protein
MLATCDNALLTVCDVQETYQIQSPDDFEQMIENLRVKQNGYMRKHGHSLSFAFERDPDRLKQRAQEAVAHHGSTLGSFS